MHFFNLVYDIGLYAHYVSLKTLGIPNGCPDGFGSLSNLRSTTPSKTSTGNTSLNSRKSKSKFVQSLLTKKVENQPFGGRTVTRSHLLKSCEHACHVSSFRSKSDDNLLKKLSLTFLEFRNVFLVFVLLEVVLWRSRRLPNPSGHP